MESIIHLEGGVAFKQIWIPFLEVFMKELLQASLITRSYFMELAYNYLSSKAVALVDNNFK